MTAASQAAETNGHIQPGGSTVSVRNRRDLLVRMGWAAADLSVVVTATFAAVWIRYDLDVTRVPISATIRFAALAAIVYLVCGIVAGPYRVGHLRGSFEETTDIGRAVLASTLPIAILLLFTEWFPRVPRSLSILVPALSIVGMFTLRFIVRSYRWGRAKADTDQEKVIVFGAGLAGHHLVRTLRQDPTSPYAPVALLDDDRLKRRLSIDGLRVRGGRDRLQHVAERTGATSMVLAIPSAPTEAVRELRDLASANQLDVLVMPPLNQIINDGAEMTDLRRINLEDLLGRRRVQLDEKAISSSIAGKVVLVTGAGGSIGSELARQISRFGPKRLILLDRDESALHSVQLSLTGRALLDDGTLALASIRDPESLREIFARERPELVFHAAALKHLTLLEQHPLEAWKTNVLGTLNVLRAADEFGVEVFVNISTDKAASPTCVLGYSKRLAERLTAHYASRNGGSRFVSVRFGNVLGSRGSVITAFTSQIEHGGPITVTDPNVERYFMLIPEASQLVLQASTIGRDGDVMVLEMGEPVKIVDVARTLIEFSGRHDIDIVYTGLRPGEKLSEELFSHGEGIQRSAHPLVNHVQVPAIGPGLVRAFSPADGEAALSWMRAQARANSTPSMHGSNGHTPADREPLTNLELMGRG